MKCAIVYFSQTGNTEKIAHAIQKGIIQAAGNCDIFKVKEANPRQMYQYDLIGIGSPVNLGESPVVTAFIKNLWGVGGKHAFAFATHGTMPQFFGAKIIPKMKRRGMIVIGLRTWFGACFLPWHPEPYPTGRTSRRDRSQRSRGFWQRDGRSQPEDICR